MANAGGALAEVEQCKTATNEEASNVERPIDEGILRIFYNNCNGLQAGELLKAKLQQRLTKKKDGYLNETIQYTKIRGLSGAMQKMDTNIMCLAETQTAWENWNVREAITKEFRRRDQYTSVTGSTSKTKSFSVVKPGGTAIISDGNWSSRTTKRGQDPSGMGRWSYLVVEGKKNSKVMIICGYRVCSGQNIKSVGPLTAYSQQYYLLREDGKKKPNPQKQFIKDLKLFISTNILTGHEILICLDANEKWEAPKSKIKKMAQELGLVDLVSEMISPPPPTYTRKGVSTRIDFILGTKKLSTCVKAVEMAPMELDRCGDHHGMIIDLNIKSLFHLNDNDTMAQTSRKLKSNDIKGVAKYIKKLKEGMETHKVRVRLKSLLLELQGKKIMNEYQKKLYEGIDEDMYRLCINSEKNIRKGKIGNFMWSPQLDQAHNITQYWKLRKEVYGNEYQTGVVILKAMKLDIQDSMYMTQHDVDNNLEQAYTKLNQIQKQDKEYRVQYLIDLADHYAATNNISRSTAIRELLVHEELRDTYRKIGNKMKTKRSPQLREVWIQDENGEKSKVYDDSESVETHLLQRNFEHLQQAKETPFAAGSKAQYLGENGHSDFTERVLNNEYLPELDDVDPVVKKYIEGLAYSRMDIPDSVDTNLTIEQYKKFWKKKKELTVTSPFGLHIGHFKSVVDEEDILEVHMQLMLIPFQYLYAPRRWLSTVQVMLEKNPGNPWSHRLRIIELFDSQLNAAMQIFFGRRMIYNALDKDEIHPSAFGSVPKRNAQDALLEKKLTFDMMVLTRTEGAIFDCDAKGCYDRIAPKLSTIHYQRLGMPSSWSQFFSLYWKECVHYVRTRYGISKESYKADAMHPLFGIGQGNGAGPATWLSHSVVMFQVLSDLNDGIIFFSPNGEVKFQSPGTGFVDDVTLGVTANLDYNGVEREEDLIRNINLIATYWEQMLNTNGGRLELKKCFWILITWKWKQGKPTMNSMEDNEAEVKIVQSENKEEVIIQRKNVDEAPKVLGCMIQANGSWEAEERRWYASALTFAMKVKKGKFDRICGSKIHPSYWVSKFRYVGALVGFNKQLCEDIEKPVVASCLSATGFNMRFPRAVVFGTETYGGMGWQSMNAIQIFEKIKSFLRNIRSGTRLGNLLEIETATAQLHAGISESILKTEVLWQKWSPNTWITHLSSNLQSIEATLDTNIRVHGPIRKYDRNLMNIFLRWQLTPTEMDYLNTCRLYLQVITVADVSTMDGSKVMQDYFKCKRVRDSTLKWPCQVDPPKKMKDMWKAAMNRLCSIGSTLVCTLGGWEKPSHQIWPYMKEVPDGTLLRYVEESQWCHYRTDEGIYMRQGRKLHPTVGGIPVDVTVTPVGYKISNDDRVQPRETVQPSKWIVDTVGHVTKLNEYKFSDMWKQGGNILVGTDGGLKNDVGTIGVHMEMEGYTDIWYTSMSAEKCSNGSLHSTREELRAILSAELLLEQFGNKWGKFDRRVTFICDSKSALGEVDKPAVQWGFRQPLGPEMDILMSIDRLRMENDVIRRVYIWEKSHQKANDTLSDSRRVNEIADGLATACRTNVLDNFMVPHEKIFFPDSKVSISIKGRRVTKHLKQAVQRACHDSELKKFLIKKYGWSETVFNDIDWGAHEACLIKRPSVYVTSIMKLIHRWQPTLTKTSQYEKCKGRITCQLCGEVEDQHHYLYCKDEKFVTARKNEWLKLRANMKRWGLHDSILMSIWSGMETWSDGGTIVACPELPVDGDPMGRELSDLLKVAYDNQNEIGWYHFHLGRLSKHWKRCIRKCYDNDDEKAEGKAEGSIRSMVENIWKMMLNLWKIRNDIEHGDDMMYSTRDIGIMAEVVDELYYRFSSTVKQEDSWMFEKKIEMRKAERVVNIATWIEIVSTIYVKNDESDYTMSEFKKKIDNVLRRMSVGSIYAE